MASAMSSAADTSNRASPYVFVAEVLPPTETANRIMYTPRRLAGDYAHSKRVASSTAIVRLTFLAQKLGSVLNV
jgi:hypothetical protein